MAVRLRLYGADCGYATALCPEVCGDTERSDEKWLRSARKGAVVRSGVQIRDCAPAVSVRLYGAQIKNR